MPLPPRLFPGDVELGKRDDDHKPGAKSPLGLAWQRRRMLHGPHRRHWKRIAMGLLALVVLYYFFKNMPTDLENPRQRPNYAVPSEPNAPPLKTITQNSNPGPSQEMTQVPRHDFNGPIKFFRLASTLKKVSKKGAELINENVLFAAASLQSAAILLPIACEMGTRGRNYVHFALMGRGDISMDILRAVNGISKDCKIIFHDGRPDFSDTSTDFRMEVSSSAGFNHVNKFVHPQATFIDGSGQEEVWFLKGIKQKASRLGRTVIELPENAEQNLMWITRLDSASLSAWNKVSIDIVVHAQPFASGSVIRLLESLKKADFFSSAPPRLVVELPHNIDEPSRRYLEHYKWPPNAGDSSGSLLTLHHRIPQHGLTPEENSIRFLESFWPADPFTSHVLVLSPQVELSPLFFHYLKYAMLEYRYSGGKSHLHKNIMSLSLDLPQTYLNDSATFTPPLFNVTLGEDYAVSGVTPFLWQAPNSNAALYFGEKWVELHDFVAQLLLSQHVLPTPTTLNEKEVSKTYPSWLEHVLKLVRARGYWTIYPNFEYRDSLATLHNDLYQLPEEYSTELRDDIASSGELTADPAQYLSLRHTETPLITTSLLTILPFEGDLPKMTEMPLLSWDGERINVSDIGKHAVAYSKVFRGEIGGCRHDAEEKARYEGAASDLFCLNDPPDPDIQEPEVEGPVEGPVEADI